MLETHTNMSGAPEEQEHETVDLTPSTVTPAILAYLRDEGLKTLSKGVLREVRASILVSLCTDSRMTDPDIRKEAYILCCVIHYHINKQNIPPVPKDFNTRIEKIIGTPMDDTEANEYVYSFILSRGADFDEDIYNLAVCRMLALNACERMQLYNYKAISPSSSTKEVCRLCDMLTRYSTECKFERTKDLYLHQVARAHLCCERISALNPFGYQSNPLKQISEHIKGDTLTQLLTPVIKTPVDEIMTSVDWKTEASNHVFILMVSLIQEMMDTHKLLLLTNTHIPFHEETERAQLFIMCENCSVASSGYGIICNSEFIVLDTIEYPIGHLLLELIKMRAHQPEGGEYRDLLMCCEQPDWVSASNPFVRLI